MFLDFTRHGKGGGPSVVVNTAAFHVRVRGSVPGLGGLKETKLFLPYPRVKVSIVGSLRDGEVACSASDRQGSNFEFCVWSTVSSQSSHQPEEVLLAQFSLYVHKGGLKPDTFHFFRHGKYITEKSGIKEKQVTLIIYLYKGKLQTQQTMPWSLTTMNDREKGIKMSVPGKKRGVEVTE